MSRAAPKVIIVTHGDVGKTLLEVAEHILGPLPFVKAIGIGWSDSPDAAIKGIEGAIEEALAADGQASSPEVLILTDMFGGTPTNVGVAYLGRGGIELVTGLNLPMLLKVGGLLGAAHDDGRTVADLAMSIRDQGRRSIEVASDLIKKR